MTAIRINTNHFTGLSHVATGTLEQALRDLSILTHSKSVSGLSDFGTIGIGDDVATKLEKVARVTVKASANTNGTTRAGVNAYIATFNNNIATIAKQINTIYAQLPYEEVTDNSGGTAQASRNVVDFADLSAGGNSLVSFESLNALLDRAESVLATLAFHANQILVAVGLEKIEGVIGNVTANFHGLFMIPSSAQVDLLSGDDPRLGETQTALNALNSMLKLIAERLDDATGQSDRTLQVIAA